MIGLSEIALLFIGINYTWAGNNITTGVDCSGLVCECLRSIGALDNRDYTAQMLYDKMFHYNPRNYITTNSILFFGKDYENITHVAIAINPRQMVEAGGEGRKETDKGYVRIRPILNRKDFIAAVNL